MAPSDKKIPNLRFPEFLDEWKEKRINEIVTRYVNPVDVEEDKDYREIGIRSYGKGIFHKEKIRGKELGNKRVFWVKENAFIVNIVFAWEQAIAKTTDAEIGFIASHRFPMYFPQDNKSSVDYLLHFFLTSKGKKILELASPGGAGRNKTLGQVEFGKSKIKLPSLSEQEKIATFLSAIDERLKLLREKKNQIEKYKRGIMQQIFSQELRFTSFDGSTYPDWKYAPLCELLDYEQPTNYLVNSTDYSEEYDIPVLTAGKTFILGYTNETHGVYQDNLPVIIFDDFTTATQFVDFPFKAKSSAMKILKAKEGNNIKYIYEAMQQIEFVVGNHGRHWISSFSNIEIPNPCDDEQSKIADFLSAIDRKILLCSEQITQNEQYKEGLLQRIFI